ncbi:hypothetical protein A9K55_000607 [Cordyceps militaris]|uniref:Uncharacterized protein n=1 Tax=Cordyceps militaris TaxID=73501 RepID=A0A2H4STY2_CORMI|nr:hypothetical protein A9K55_000607 [Cordyceps militaris]
MSEAVKHWNECIQITTEESDRAKSTIQGLKKKLSQQANELQLAQDAVQKGDTGFRTLHKQYQDLETREIRATEDKKNLEVKFKELFVDHEKLRTQVKEMSTKFNSCEGRLGSAITEQRELSNQFKNFYVNLTNQMNQDGAVEKANAEAVEKALQDSKQKREELKKVVEHIQRDFQYNKTEYERRIISLEKENESQCDQIDAIEEDKERYYNEMVSNRSTKECIERVNSRLSGFITQLRALDASQDMAAIELRDVKIKVDDLPGSHDFAELKEQVSGSHTKLSSLEKLILERLLPAIDCIASKQSESQVSAKQLTTAVEDGLAKLQGQIQTHAIDFGQTIKSNHKSHTEILNLLTLISAANGDVASRVEVGNNRLESLVEAISSNGTIGICMQAIFESTQSLSEHSGKIVSTQEKAQSEVQRLQEVLAGQIDAKFQAQDRVSRELFAGLKENFETNLAVWKANIAPESARRASSTESASMNHKTIQDVEVMRSNLQQVESQLAKIEDIPLSLQKIYDLSVLIQETSKYMDREEKWVQETMAGRALHSDGSRTTEKSASQTSSCQSPESSSPGFGPGSQEGPGGTCADSQIRKVVVQSPRPQEDSPLPVTAAEEQRRRRESARPRSILKLPQNKTVVAKGLVASIRNGFHTSEEVISDIRSAFVQSPIPGSPSSHQTTGLTPMTEYLRLNKAASRRRGIVLGDLADVELRPGQTVTAMGVAATI